MANRTVKDAITVRGTNPQYLVEKIIRTRIYESRYWKEKCFGISVEDMIDRSYELRYVGGIYAGNIKPTEFLCLTLKLLQLQPEKAIILEFLQQEHHKYLRALAAMYIRLTFSSVEIYNCLELLYRDYRKLRYKNRMGHYELLHMDEFIDHLLRDEGYCDITLPRLQKRQALEDTDQLKLYESALDEDLENLSSESEDEVREKPQLVSRRRSKSKELDPYEKRDRHRKRYEDSPPRSSRHDRDKRRDRSEERERSRRDRRDDRGDDCRDRKKKDDKNDEEREIAEANEVRAKLGMAPLDR
ncbi:Pre-mRNA-splicing factor 38 [Aphelenchoides besseyi]|nr:Pre-mRNA-splicing factor 38 [Aphelenchoides besseyi]KAI6210835.1 Pre-mRNA-splicing factor 38 [Aphelenchoides besseyi]